MGPGAAPRRFAAVHESGPIEPYQHMEEIIDRVNRNSAGMDFLMKASGVDATGQYIENGKTENYDLNGTLLYRRPRDLYLQLQHSLGGKIDIGSNDQEFWVWKRLGRERYWWGRQAAADANHELDIPLRPTDIVDMLGLARLEVQPRSGFRVGEDRYEIAVPSNETAGGPSHPAKRVYIDRRPPYLVREVTYYGPDGSPRAQAALSNYAAITGSNVLAPHRIQIRWPDKGSYMNLTFDAVSRFRESREVVRRFSSPVQQGRDVDGMERVDQPLPRAERW